MPAQGHVAEGDVPDQVIHFAKTHDVDLVVMATRGLSGLNRFLLGSVTERVVRAAPCPVLTLNAHQENDADEAAETASVASE